MPEAVTISARSFSVGMVYQLSVKKDLPNAGSLTPPLNPSLCADQISTTREPRGIKYGSGPLFPTLALFLPT
jgi:hypothetical protein